jgi:RimJ/RimL family protein N-acetyltransferase
MLTMLEEGYSDPPLRRCWMAEHKNQLVGHVQLAFDWRNGNATLGRVAIDPGRRGQGLAAPMVQLAMIEAFSWPQIERLELNVYTFNQTAIQVYNKLGFVLEGTRRSSTRVGNERWDTSIMAILRPDFPLNNK